MATAGATRAAATADVAVLLAARACSATPRRRTRAVARLAPPASGAPPRAAVEADHARPGARPARARRVRARRTSWSRAPTARPGHRRRSSGSRGVTSTQFSLAEPASRTGRSPWPRSTRRVPPVHPAAAPNSRPSGTGWPAVSWRSGAAQGSCRRRRRLPAARQRRGRAPVHIGAYAPQCRRSTRWSTTSGSRTRHAARQRAAGPHRRDRSPVGADGSSRLFGDDARSDPRATRIGLDPGAAADRLRDRQGGRRRRHLPLHRPRRRPDRPRGRPGWPHIATEGVPILGAVTCNRMVFPQLKAALPEIVAQGLADKIDPDQYAGCYYPRFIAGTTELSNHAFGLALDLNAAGQPARHRRRRWTAPWSDLPAVGLHLGRRLGLHRPDALRDERPRHARSWSRPSRTDAATAAAGRRWCRRAAVAVLATSP